MATGMMPNVNGIGGGAIGTSLIFGESAGSNRKRSIEVIEDEWVSTGSTQDQESRETKRVKAER